MPIFDRLSKSGAKIRQALRSCQLPKACKNPLEIEGMRKAHIRDGAALARYSGLVRANAAAGELTEIEAARETWKASAAPPASAERRILRHHLRGGQQRRHRALPRHPLHQPHHQRGEMFLLDTGRSIPTAPPM